MIKRWVESRWFGLADLGCAALSGVLWYGRPGVGWWPLLIALAPWALRLGAGRSLFRRTWFDIPLAVFLITAIIGIWAAYNRDAAWIKFWVIVSAALLFYALSGQREANLWIVTGLLSLGGVLISVYFLLTHDWQAESADLGIVNRIGVWWMWVRPPVQGLYLHPNVAGGLLVMLAPLPLALALRAWCERSVPNALFALATGGVTATGLLFTSSRAAWLALAAALGIWLLWSLSAYGARWGGRSREVVFALALLMVSVPVIWFVATYPGGLEALANRLPGAASGTTRMELYRNTLNLAADFPFTGGGLGAFAGLYTRYLMVISPLLFTYAHNLYLDVSLEQGLFGLLALGTGLLGSVGVLIAEIGRKQTPLPGLNLLRWALLTGFIAVGLHGLMDDALYGNRGTPLLFLLVGMTVAVGNAGRRSAMASASEVSPGPLGGMNRRRSKAGGIVALILALIALLLVFQARLRANWYANLGAAQMARVELSGWPAVMWEEKEVRAELASAEALFNQALQLEADNRIARYHLGLIEGRKGDYAAAITHLEKAYQANPAHRGARKVLGYLYVWEGRLDEAVPLLVTIAEAGYDMDGYAWWWRTQGREDLAARAALMAQRLEAAQAVAGDQPARQPP